MRQPFFREQSNDSNIRQLEDLKAKLEAQEKSIASSKNAIIKAEKDTKVCVDQM